VKPTFFATPIAFRAWFKKHHKTAGELLVGFYRKASGRPTMTWSESVDEALCFGWIDGVGKKVNDEAYCIRFTPRRSSSTWSAINIDKVAQLTKEGRMQPAGVLAFEQRSEARSRIYAHEQKEAAVFEPALEKLFKARKAAWRFFCEQPPYYRKQMTHRVCSAKQESTRLRRLDKLMAACESGRRLT